jgi:transcriptional regulator with GAF, ATPase, and Fis domain
MSTNLYQITGSKGPLRFEPLAAAPVLQKIEISEKPDAVIQPLEEMIARHIKRALAHTGGKVEGEKGAARMLRLHPSTLRGRMKKLGIPYGRKGQPR